MGLIGMFLNTVFGGGSNAIRETAEVFRPNAEALSQRDSAIAHAALQQFAAEFTLTRKSWFDHLMDGVNRVPRPALALGTLGMIVSAMVDPIWFAARMQGVSLVPEPLWWLLGIIVSFYFGARHQTKAIQFQKTLAATMAQAPAVAANIALLEGARAPAGDRDHDTGHDDPGADDAPHANPALADWRRGRDG